MLVEPLPLAAWAEALARRLGASAAPVEREIAALMAPVAAPAPLGVRQRFIFERLHRKIDVAHRVMAAYDEAYRQATLYRQISRDGYLGLTWAFVLAARREADEGHGAPAARARRLRWVNSGFNSLDAAGAADDNAAVSLLNLLRDLARGAL